MFCLSFFLFFSILSFLSFALDLSVDKMIAEVDQNGAGYIDFKEFQVFLFSFRFFLFFLFFLLHLVWVLIK